MNPQRPIAVLAALGTAAAMSCAEATLCEPSSGIRNAVDRPAGAAERPLASSRIALDE